MECHKDELKCLNGTNILHPASYKCYFKSYFCDGVEDCSDGSDEMNCTNPRTCLNQYTPCINGLDHILFVILLPLLNSVMQKYKEHLVKY